MPPVRLSQQLLLPRIFDYALNFIAERLRDAACDFQFRRRCAVIEGGFERDAEFPIVVLSVPSFAPVDAHQVADVLEGFLLFEFGDVSSHSWL